VTRMASRRGRPSRSRKEFDQFVVDSVDGLLRTAYLMAWDFAAAEDLVQECLLRVARQWPRVRSMEYPTAYARKVLVHLALDDGRRRSRQQDELGRADTHPVAEHADDSAVRVLSGVESSTDLTRALGELAPRQRVTLMLRYFDDLSEAQVAEVMGCSVGTVKSTTSRALERLRVIVGPPSPGTTAVGNGRTENREQEGSVTDEDRIRS
jgi:RNA polymerase sigma-70 factor (sigma-E family)